MEYDKLSADEKKLLASAFGAFRKSDVYLYWKSVVEGQINGRVAIVMRPTKSVDETYEQEYTKGETQGLQAALNLFTMLEEHIESELPAQTEESENEQ